MTECLFQEFGSSAGSDRGCSGTSQARRAAVARAAQVDRVAVVRRRALVRTELRVMRKCGAYQKAFLQLRWALAVCEDYGHTWVGLGELVHVLLFDDRNGLQCPGKGYQVSFAQTGARVSFDEPYAAIRSSPPRPQCRPPLPPEPSRPLDAHRQPLRFAPVLLGGRGRDSRSCDRPSCPLLAQCLPLA